MNELIRNLKLALIELKKDEKYENIDHRSLPPASEEVLKKAKKTGFNEDLISLYRKTDGFEAEWNYVPDTEGRTFGHLRILEIESVLGADWEEFFYAESADIRLKYFTPLDYCSVNNMYCGLVLDGSGNQAMYAYDFSDVELMPLDIDFKSYFELAIDAKVMYGWQDYLIHQITPRNFIIDFPEKMKIFPDFDLEAFTAKFESMRLSKK